MNTNNGEGGYKPTAYTEINQRGELYARIIMARLPRDDEPLVTAIPEDTIFADSEFMHIVELPTALEDLF